MPEPAPDAPHDPAPGQLTSLHVRHALAGDGESLDWLVRRLSPLLHAQARHRLSAALRAQHDPEDLVHEAWLVALPRLDRLEARDGRYTPVLLKFLSTSLSYLIANLSRRQLRANPAAPPAADGDRPPGSVGSMPADVTGVVTRAVRDEQWEAVRRALDELDEIDREVILIRGIEQLPSPAAAAMLGVTPEALRMRYHRALRRLRAQLPNSVFDELADD